MSQGSNTKPEKDDANTADLLAEFQRFIQSLLKRDFTSRLDTDAIQNEKFREVALSLNSLSDEMDLMVRSHRKIEADFRTPTQETKEQAKKNDFAGVEIGAWGWDLDGDPNLDLTCKALFGLTNANFQGKAEAWLRVIHPDDRTNFLDVLERLHTAGKGSLSLQLRVQLANGSNRHLAMKATMIIASRLQGAVWDVSAEASSLILLNRLRASLDASAIVAATDLAGNIKTVNEKFCEISGYSRDELLGKNHRILNSGYHPKEFFQEMWRTIQEGKIWHGIICNRRKNGESYWVNSTIIPFKSADGRIEEYFSVRFDFTQQKHLEQQMVYAAKMSSLGEMAGSIVHEINNPLAIIQGKSRQVLRVLENSSVDSALVRRHVEAIETTTERIVKIMQGIRAFSRDGTQSPMENEKVNKIIKDILAMSSARFSSAGVELRCAEPGEDLEIMCRPVQIAQVLLNLLNNAFDAVRENKVCWVALDIADKGDMIELSVTDSGAGISEDVGKKIFQPFFTTKPKGEGTGLGLGIATSIVEAHGGSLKVDHSCANTRFVAHLPKGQPSKAPLSKARTSA